MNLKYTAAAALLLLLLAGLAAAYLHRSGPSPTPAISRDYRPGEPRVTRGTAPLRVPPVTIADTAAVPVDSSRITVPVADSLLAGTVTVTTWPRVDSVRIGIDGTLLTSTLTRVDTLLLTAVQAPEPAPAAPPLFWEGAALGALLIIIITLLTGKGN